MTTHHVCPHPGRHTLRIAGVVALYTFVTVFTVPRALMAHAPQPLWWLLLLLVVPGIALVKTLAQWRCQPEPSAGWRGRDWLLLAAFLAGRR